MISQWVNEVENLMNGKMECVHARRLMWYCADREGKEANPALREYAMYSETTYQNLEKLVDIRDNGNVVEVLVE